MQIQDLIEKIQHKHSKPISNRQNIAKRNRKDWDITQMTINSTKNAAKRTLDAHRRSTDSASAK